MIGSCEIPALRSVRSRSGPSASSLLANDPVGSRSRAAAARWAACTSLIFGVAPLAFLPALATALLATRSTLPFAVTATLSIAVETSIESTRCCRYTFVRPLPLLGTTDETSRSDTSALLSPYVPARLATCLRAMETARVPSGSADAGAPELVTDSTRRQRLGRRRCGERQARPSHRGGDGREGP